MSVDVEQTTQQPRNPGVLAANAVNKSGFPALTKTEPCPGDAGSTDKVALKLFCQKVERRQLPNAHSPSGTPSAETS